MDAMGRLEQPGTSDVRRAVARLKGDTPMKRILVATVLATFALGSSAMAQDASCETKAMGKEGNPLAGAAKTALMKKCTTEACAAKAVSADGKKLAGAAKTPFIKKS